MLSIGDSVQLEQRIQTAGRRCAEHAAKHGSEDPDLLVEYGKALFEMAKHSASLVDQKRVDEKQMPRENPNVKIVLPTDFVDDDEAAADGAQLKDAEATLSGSQERGKDTGGEAGEGGDQPEKAADEPSGELSGETSASRGPGSDSDAQADGADAPAEAADSEAENIDDDASDAEGTGGDDDFAEAFQIIDLARVLYEKLPDSDAKLRKLASTRALLGDISLEDDNPDQAIEDLTAASALKAQAYGADSGELSESEFMLSLAYDSVGRAADALEHLRRAAHAARASGLPAAAELEQRVADAEQELALQGARSADGARAAAATRESITGRDAIATAVQSIVSGANDISQLARKRKRPADEAPSKK